MENFFTNPVPLPGLSKVEENVIKTGSIATGKRYYLSHEAKKMHGQAL